MTTEFGELRGSYRIGCPPSRSEGSLTRPLLFYGPGQFFRKHIAPNDCASTGVAYDTIFETESPTMGNLPDPATLTDRELIDEWGWISADA